MCSLIWSHITYSQDKAYRILTSCCHCLYEGELQKSLQMHSYAGLLYIASYRILKHVKFTYSNIYDGLCKTPYSKAVYAPPY